MDFGAPYFQTIPPVAFSGFTLLAAAITMLNLSPSSYHIFLYNGSVWVKHILLQITLRSIPCPPSIERPNHPTIILHDINLIFQTISTYTFVYLQWDSCVISYQEESFSHISRGLPEMVVPQNGSKWIVYNGKSLYKWMITGGTSILGNLHIP